MKILIKKVKQQNSLFTLLLLSLFFVVGCQNKTVKPKMKFTDMTIEKKIESLLPLLTLDEKIDLIHAQSKFSTPGVARLGIPELWMSDGPHGVRGEINWDNWGYADWTNDYITAFPALTCLAASFNPILANKYGESLGEEARYRKKDVILGPGVNIYRTPLNGRNFEYMGEDPFLSSTMVVPYIQGLQSKGVAACVKHYALNTQEQWRMGINVKVSKRALYEIYLPAFKAAITKGKAWAIMGAYNQYLNEYCCHNDFLLNKVLKTDWKFDGTVITDWGGAHDTRQAALNGLDIEMGTGSDGLTYSLKNAYDNYYMANPLLKLVKNGEIKESLINDKVKRVMRLRYRTNMSKNRAKGIMNNIEHQQIARKIATEGIVLLKNKNQFFPIKLNSKLTIAVIGENATRSMTVGGGSSELKAKYEISPLQGLKAAYKKANIIHALGYASGPPVYGHVEPSKLDAKKLRKEAISVAAKADVVLFFGGLNKNHHQDCEGGDRLQYGLPFGQDELIKDLLKVNKNLGIVLISGNAVAMPWIDKVKAVMETWYLGSESGHAIADVISGSVNPSGKLPFSFPVKLEDNAAIHYGKTSFPGDSISQEFKEGIFVGYRWFDTKKIKPLFAFGHGLSYTNFDLSDIKSDKKNYNQNDQIEISCNLKNTGKRAGAEVIQVYVGKPHSEVDRAIKELKAFKKVFLKPNESQKVTLNLNTADLKYFDEKIDDWKLEKGGYTIYVGTASDKIIKKIKVNIVY